MVFCGKPSRGCHACRARKTKCDALPTGCTQCLNAGRQCPGYRAQVDLIFREETKNVIKKAKVKHEKARQKNNKASTSPPDSSATYYPSPESCNSLELYDKSPPLVQIVSPTYLNITPSIEDRATAFFISNYVIGDHGPTRGHLDRLADLYEADSIDDNLVTAVHAVGLAGYSHSAKAPELKLQARAQYTKALQLTNAALRSPTDVKKDSTLMAILILGIYETITGNNQKSMKAWAEHIHGAAAVIKLRGPEAVKSPGGIRLLAQVTSSLLISCIQRDIPIPKFIVEMTAIAEKSLNRVDPAWKAQKLMIKFAKFNARYCRGYYTDPYEIIRMALEIDGQFLEFSTNTPPGWEFATIYTDKDPDIVFDGHYHVYYDHWVAQIWNAIRELRIMLNMAIRDTIIKDFSSATPILLGPEFTAHLQITLDTIHVLSAEILASVPQHVGYTAKATPLNPWSNFRMDGIQAEFPIVRFSGGYFLLWPLFLVGNLPTATERTRAFVLKNLRFIATQMGIMQANLLAEVMEKRLRITAWQDHNIAPSMEELGE